MAYRAVYLPDQSGIYLAMKGVDLAGAFPTPWGLNDWELLVYDCD